MTEANTSPGSGSQQGSMEDNLTSKRTWVRFVFMVIYVVIANVVGIVAGLVTLLSFLVVLFTGDVNPKLQSAGDTIARYLADIVRYLTYNTEVRPFPFDDDLRASGDS
jgi:hypothetical protein